MKAIMLCAGEGVRCYPFTYLSPKMMQEVCGIPILEYMLSWFGGAQEIDKLYIVVRHDSIVEALRNYIRKRISYLEKILSLFSHLGYQVEYVNPNLDIEILKANGWGTGGDLRSAINQITSMDKLGDDFLVCNGDYVPGYDGRLNCEALTRQLIQECTAIVHIGVISPNSCWG